MASCKSTLALVMISTVLCAAAMSCKPRSGQMSRDESGRTAQGQASNGLLTKEQIIEIANREARKRGVRPERMNVYYDEGNVEWKSMTIESGPPESANLDYQAVSYWHQPPQPEGGLWILVDRNTGRVLLVARLP